MSNIIIDWKGFVPTEETKNQTENIMQGLKYILPPESQIRVSFERFSNKNIEAQIVVRSALGDFAAREEDKDLFTLCKSLRRNIKQQIFKHRDAHSVWQRAS